jgi:hypothetical protein
VQDGFGLKSRGRRGQTDSSGTFGYAVKITGAQFLDRPKKAKKSPRRKGNG